MNNIYNIVDRNFQSLYCNKGIACRRPDPNGTVTMEPTRDKDHSSRGANGALRAPDGALRAPDGALRAQNGASRRPRRTPKGRQVDPGALEEVRGLLGERSRRRDLLIEHLHLIQDAYGHLSAAHLAALAQEMKLALTEVYEVATFYAHFDVVKEGEAPPPAVTVRVCDSLSCAMAGAEHLLRELPGRLGRDVRVMRAPCMGACDRAPVCAVGHAQVMQANADTVAAAAAHGSYPDPYPTPKDFDA